MTNNTGGISPNVSGGNVYGGMQAAQGNNTVQTSTTYSSPEQKQNLAEAAAEIQALLEQLSQSYPTDTMSGKMALAAEATQRIEKNPTLMLKTISALRAGGTAALEQALSHPAASFVIAALDDWSKNIKQVTNNDLYNSQFGGGLINAESVKAGQIGGDIYNIYLKEQTVASRKPVQSQNQWQHSQHEKDLLEKSYTLQHEKVEKIRKALSFETDPSLKLKLQQQLNENEHALEELSDNLNAIEQQLQSIKNSRLEADTNVSQEAKLTFLIDGVISDIDESNLKAINALLQSISGDSSIKIISIEEGSIKLTLGGSPKALAKLVALFEEGELTEILGFPVIDVKFKGEEEAEYKAREEEYKKQLKELDNELKQALREKADSLMKVILSSNDSTMIDNQNIRHSKSCAEATTISIENTIIAPSKSFGSSLNDASIKVDGNVNNSDVNGGSIKQGIPELTKQNNLLEDKSYSHESLD